MDTLATTISEKRSMERFDISFVMPAYNEEEIVGYTMRRLVSAFEKEGYRVELVVVDNGSEDRTGEVIQDFAAEHAGIICCPC